jgi:hypothetical protein
MISMSIVPLARAHSGTPHRILRLGSAGQVLAVVSGLVSIVGFDRERNDRLSTDATSGPALVIHSFLQSPLKHRQKRRMSFTILVLTFLIAFGGFVDFLIGPPGHRRVKEQLVKFYVALEEGDWTMLYRRPANALFQLMNKLLGPNQFSIRYIFRTLAMSVGMTLLLFVTSMTWTYVTVAISETRCPVPPITQFFQIFPYMGDFLIFIFVINFIFDYFSWSLTQRTLHHLSNSRGFTPIAISLLAPLVIVVLLYVIYSIYLPLSIVVQMNKLGGGFGFDQFRQIFLANIHTNLHLIQIPRLPFHLNCPTRSHTFFSLSYISTMQILAIETVIPIGLLFASTIFGILAYLTKPLTKRPASLLVERIDSSEQRATVVVLGFAAAILALLIALMKYRNGGV